VNERILTNKIVIENIIEYVIAFENFDNLKSKSFSMRVLAFPLVLEFCCNLFMSRDLFTYFMV